MILSEPNEIHRNGSSAQVYLVLAKKPGGEAVQSHFFVKVFQGALILPLSPWGRGVEGEGFGRPP
jgi:hypothetical protein